VHHHGHTDGHWNRDVQAVAEAEAEGACDDDNNWNRQEAIGGLKLEVLYFFSLFIFIINLSLEVLKSSLLFLFIIRFHLTAQIALFENGVAAARFSASTTAKQRTTGFHIDGGRPATAFAGASSPCCCWRWTQQAA
jgi:hypothetical protein